MLLYPDIPDDSDDSDYAAVSDDGPSVAHAQRVPMPETCSTRAVALYDYQASE